MSNTKNPYQRGNYSKLFAYWQSEKKGIVTRQEMIAFAMSKLGMKDTEAAASVTVILSPRESTTREGADPRGNFSAQGHLYFAEPLNKEKGEDRKFRLRWRKSELAKRTRNGEVKAKAKKVAKPAKKSVKVAKPARKAKTPSVKVTTAPAVAPAAPVTADAPAAATAPEAQ